MKEGDVVDGRWRIAREIGSGGMGIVYAAKDLELGIDVALKVLRGDVRELEGTVERFLREVRLAAQLESPHAARIHASGTSRGVPYMVMELLEGANLSRVAKLRQRIAETDAVEWIADACDAVGEAHELGIVHRDLKLGNLFLSLPPSGAPVVKVLDFGLAKNLLADEKSLTSPLDGFGTPQYMPPEQYVSIKEVDERSDVWSLAVCLYRLVAGVYPMRGATMAQLCIEVARPDFVAPSVRSHVPHLSTRLERVLERALSRDKYDRHENAVELCADLRSVAPTNIARPPARNVTPSSCTRISTALLYRAS